MVHMCFVCVWTYGQFSCCQSSLGQWSWDHAWRKSEEVSHHLQQCLLKMHRENDYITHDALKKKNNICWLGHWKINLPWSLTWEIEQMFYQILLYHIRVISKNIPVCTCTVNPHKPPFFYTKVKFTLPDSVSHQQIILLLIVENSPAIPLLEGET